jgi:hypothetical protein
MAKIDARRRSARALLETVLARTGPSFRCVFLSEGEVRMRQALFPVVRQGQLRSL